MLADALVAYVGTFSIVTIAGAALFRMTSAATTRWPTSGCASGCLRPRLAVPARLAPEQGMPASRISTFGM
ncbi:hypothetical protein D9M68_664920 [compost metagenome]